MAVFVERLRCSALEICDAGDGKYYIQSKLGTVLDVTSASAAAGTNVQTYTFNQSTAQKWTLLETEKTL